MTDPFNLRRFIEAQDPVLESVRAELRGGRKVSHWMWFIFPQLQRLGASPTARFYGIASLEEARAYLEHQLLGARLRECTVLTNQVRERSVESIFGYPDHLKFRSCMTLFAHAAAEHSGQSEPFRAALQKYFAGAEDPRTRELLSAEP